MINPILDLGRLQGPVILFGGPYSNLAATQAMRAEAQRLLIPPERVICTGDIIAYCAEPAETLELIRDWGIPVVQGNCEQSLGNDAPDCGCGFDAGSSCSLLSVEWYRFAHSRVTEEQKTWMAELPGQLEFQLGALRFRVVHGSNRNINEFIFPGTPGTLKQSLLTASHADVVIGGHCGIPFSEKFAGGYWLNAGVVGMPANDGTEDGWYLRLEPTDEGIAAHWRRLQYDALSSQKRMRDLDLCRAYSDALTSGIWPSNTILPESDRTMTGQPLKVQSINLHLTS